MSIAIQNMSDEELRTAREIAWEEYKAARNALHDVRSHHGATRIKRDAVARYEAAKSRREALTAECIARLGK